MVLGTRPEAIKLCPLIQALRQQSDWETLVCVTGQHRQMLDQVLRAFEITPNFDLDLMQPNQTLSSLTSRLMAGLEKIFEQAKPSFAIVQGDTTTTLCAALTAFYLGVPVGHVEAGLRTFDLKAPFPEEMNRVAVSRLATLHFAATQGAAENLRKEGVAAAAIEVTGNTGIDAILAINHALDAGRLRNETPIPLDSQRKLLVVTAHRRENFGENFRHICEAVLALSRRTDAQIVWPVHPNPNIQEFARQFLRDKANVQLIQPLDYVPFVDLMRRAFLVITDSGGIQEEGPSLGKPILLMREKTERPEAVKAGTVKLVGTATDSIVRAAALLMDDADEYQRMARLQNPYGDGQASTRIVSRLREYLRATPPPDAAKAYRAHQ